MLFCMNYNAFYRGPDGLAPCIRRFGTPHQFRPYPFGAFFLHTHPNDASQIEHTYHEEVAQSVISVGVTVGPGGQWARSCCVDPIAFLLSETRASRVLIRTIADVHFPEVASFPLQQRFTLHGAFEDPTLPAPMITDDTEKWAVMAEERADDVLAYDGICKGNALRLRNTRAVDMMMAIDLDTAPADPVDTPGEQAPVTHDFVAIEHEVEYVNCLREPLAIQGVHQGMQ